MIKIVGSEMFCIFWNSATNEIQVLIAQVVELFSS